MGCGCGKSFSSRRSAAPVQSSRGNAPIQMARPAQQQHAPATAQQHTIVSQSLAARRQASTRRQV